MPDPITCQCPIDWQERCTLPAVGIAFRLRDGYATPVCESHGCVGQTSLIPLELADLVDMVRSLSERCRVAEKTLANIHESTRSKETT